MYPIRVGASTDGRGRAVRALAGSVTGSSSVDEDTGRGSADGGPRLLARLGRSLWGRRPRRRASKAHGVRWELSMCAAEIDEVGPVDYVVVEFPAGQSSFSGEMAAELAALVESGTIRLLDLLVVTKADDGSVEAFEIDDVDHDAEGDEDVAVALRGLETEIAEVLAAEDVALLAEAMEAGSTAGVVVWENAWAAPFASAARRAGGQLVASGRIPIQAIAASIEAEDAQASEGD